eukprot:m.56914 g.56914  ORF g.56914 m.56914 type:complete len:742 (+) comp13698_c0_seq1:258-2483(+)
MDVLAFDPCDQPLAAYDAELAAELHKFGEEQFGRHLTPLEHAGSSLVTTERLTFSPTTFKDDLAHYHDTAEAGYDTLSQEVLDELMRHDLGPPQRTVEETLRTTSATVPQFEYQHDRRYSCSAPPRYEHIPIPLRFDPNLDHREVVDLVGWLVFLQAATVRTVRLRQHLAEPGTIADILDMNRTEFPGVVQLFPRMAKCRSMLELFYKETLFHHLSFGSMFQSAQDPHRPFRLLLAPPSDSQPVMMPEPNSSLNRITQALLDRGHVLLKRANKRATPQREQLRHMRPLSDDMDTNTPSKSLTTLTEPAGTAPKRAKADANEAKQQHTTVFSYVLWCFGVLPLEAGCHTNITPDAPIVNLCSWGCRNDKTPVTQRRSDLQLRDPKRAKRTPTSATPRRSLQAKLEEHGGLQCYLDPIDAQATDNTSPLLMDASLMGPTPTAGESLQTHASTTSLGSFASPQRPVLTAVRQTTPSTPILTGVPGLHQVPATGDLGSWLDTFTDPSPPHSFPTSQVSLADQPLDSVLFYPRHEPKTPACQMLDSRESSFVKHPTAMSSTHRPHKASAFSTPAALGDRTNSAAKSQSISDVRAGRRSASATKKSGGRSNLKYAESPRKVFLEHSPSSPLIRKKQLVCYCGNPAHHAPAGEAREEALSNRAEFIRETLNTCVAHERLALATDEALINGAMPCFCPTCFESSINWLNREFTGSSKHYFPLKISEAHMPHVRAYLTSLRNDGCDPAVA